MSAEYNTHDPYQGVKHASDPSPTVRLEEHLEALERHAALVADDQAMNTMDSGNPPRDQASNQSDTIHVESEARRSQLLDREIMIVDDEPLIVEATRYHLGSVGYRNLESYCDSRDAVERLKTHCPDVLLLDMVMPNLSGIYILHLVSSSDHLMHLPVIVMTAERCPKRCKEALTLGATDYLIKPVAADNLIPRVENALMIHDQIKNMNAKIDELQLMMRRRSAEAVRAREMLMMQSAGRDPVTGSTMSVWGGMLRDHAASKSLIRPFRYLADRVRQLGWRVRRSEDT